MINIYVGIYSPGGVLEITRRWPIMKLFRRDLLKIGAVAATSAAGGILLPGPARAREDESEYFKFPESIGSGRRIIEDAPERIVEHGLIRCGLYRG